MTTKIKFLFFSQLKHSCRHGVYLLKPYLFTEEKVTGSPMSLAVLVTAHVCVQQSSTTDIDSEYYQ